jgi:LmbE family N-acetylglucosaminyl deacetylase
MEAQKLRILVIGAHPDDCDLKAGGVAALYRTLGHEVRFLSVTNGEAGHFAMSGRDLADRRREEARKAGASLGIRYDVLDHRDGRLQPTLDARFGMIALIRDFQPDLILTHRPNDYHPDHRYTSQLVCDAAYMVTVPPIVPESPALNYNPVIAFLADRFQRPYPFTPTIAVDIEPVIEQIVDMLHCHESQFYEWLPHNNFCEHPPAGAVQRRAWLGERYREWIAPLANEQRNLLVKIYGAEHGLKIRYIEAFEPCEYGAPLDEGNRLKLFPFLPR